MKKQILLDNEASKTSFTEIDKEPGRTTGNRGLQEPLRRADGSHQWLCRTCLAETPSLKGPPAVVLGEDVVWAK